MRWPTRRDSGRRRPLALALGAAAVIAGVVVLVVAVFDHGSAPPASFYEYDAALPTQAGALLRQAATRAGIPAGARGWRILYTTTEPGGRIVTASGLVVAADAAPATPRDVLLWEHGTTGVARQCAPSLLKDPFAAGGMPALGPALAAGWAVVAPDYVGLGTGPAHPYLVGIPEANSALDAVRAARQLSGLQLGLRTVVWGDSQGGGAALWTALEAPGYAPDVAVTGVAGLAPADDLLSLVRGLEQTPSGRGLASFVLKGYSDVYADVALSAYLTPGARRTVQRALGRCLSAPTFPAGEPIFSRGLTTGPLGTRLAQNIPDSPSGIPTLIAQGTSDEQILPAVQRAFVQRLCATGQPLEYRTYPGLDHAGLVRTSSPLSRYLLSWTRARFAGARAPDDCAALPR